MLKNSMVFLIMFSSFMIAANVAPPVIEYVKYEGGISDVPASIENSNTIYRDADLDSLFDIQRESIIYRATLEDDQITKIVKFNIDEENKTYYSDYYRFMFSDHCVEQGKYLYISDLDCSEFINEFRSVRCMNYAEIEFEEPTDTTLCNPDKYENVELTEDQINTLKTGMSGNWATLEIEEYQLAFNAEIGSKDDRLITIKNESDKFKSFLELFEDRFPKDPFHVILSDAEGSCKHGLILAPQESCTLYIRFAPEAAGIYEDEFWIESSYYYYDYVDLTGRCTGEVSDDLDNEVDEDNLNSDSDSETNDGQISGESPDELETNDDAEVKEDSSDGCSVIIF